MINASTKFRQEIQSDFRSLQYINIIVGDEDYIFTNEDLVSLEKTQEIDPLGRRLNYHSLSFEIYNNGRFDPLSNEQIIDLNTKIQLQFGQGYKVYQKWSDVQSKSWQEIKSETWGYYKVRDEIEWLNTSTDNQKGIWGIFYTDSAPIITRETVKITAVDWLSTLNSLTSYYGINCVETHGNYKGTSYYSKINEIINDDSIIVNMTEEDYNCISYNSCLDVSGNDLIRTMATSLNRVYYITTNNQLNIVPILNTMSDYWITFDNMLDFPTRETTSITKEISNTFFNVYTKQSTGFYTAEIEAGFEQLNANDVRLIPSYNYNFTNYNYYFISLKEPCNWTTLDITDENNNSVIAYIVVSKNDINFCNQYNFQIGISKSVNNNAISKIIALGDKIGFEKTVSTKKYNSGGEGLSTENDLLATAENEYISIIDDKKHTGTKPNLNETFAFQYNWLKKRNNFNIKYTGDPTLECLDNIYIQVKENETANTPIKILKHKLTFNGSLKGEILGKDISDEITN